MDNCLEKKDSNNKHNIMKKILSGHKLEWLVLVIYVLLYIVVTIFHEPWFDEAQAWQIPRSASLKDILFFIPHYEGHPAFWHLLLLIPARLGLPYELSIKIIGGIIITVAVYILEFKSPLKRWFKLLLPFTFFFFYQYGIIVRPYGLMLVFTMLAACTFKKRNEHPFRFVFCLIGMCLCSAFGILIAGGITIAWVIDILREKAFSKTVKEIFTTKRFASLWMLLGVALLLVLQIMPYSNTFATGIDKKNTFWERIICTLFTFLPDTFLTESSSTSCEVMLMDHIFKYRELILVSLVGIALWIIVWLVSSKGMFKYVIIPYVLFAIFAAATYFSAHHLGLVLFIIMFWAWANEESSEKYYYLNILKSKIFTKYSNLQEFWANYKKKIKGVVLLVEVLIVLLSVYYNVQSCIAEVNYEYSYGRGAANFIKENNLEDCIIVSEWMVVYYDETELEEMGYDKDTPLIKKIDTNYVNTPVNFYPYFEKNGFIINLPEGYINHINPTDEDNQERYELMKQAGVPDVVIGYVDVGMITDNKYQMIDYSPVYKLQMHFIWKGYEHPAYNYIFVRNDLLDEYGFTSLYEELGSN